MMHHRRIAVDGRDDSGDSQRAGGNIAVREDRRRVGGMQSGADRGEGVPRCPRLETWHVLTIHILAEARERALEGAV